MTSDDAPTTAAPSCAAAESCARRSGRSALLAEPLRVNGEDPRADLAESPPAVRASTEGPAPAGPPATAALQTAIARAALTTLAVANLVGLWMAVLLIWPRLGAAAGELTYGRWAPVHLDLQLYGWCSLPAIGLLLARFLPRGGSALRQARLALVVWCGALAAGAASWLAGDTSGKIFLDWSGPAGLAFACAQLFFWSVLAAGWWARTWGKCPLIENTSPTRLTADAVLLLALLGVPIALHLSARPEVYPPINPHSGGATGHSLLASSLAIVGLALALPLWLGRAPRAAWRRCATLLLLAFAGHWLLYAAIPHGNASNHEPAQIVALGTLAIWPPLLSWWFRQFTWAAPQRRWLASSAAWAALLVLDGFALFLPDVLAGTKFTNALVAHAHLAMAGLLTSLNFLMLIAVAPDSALSRALAARGAWMLWNGACLGMVLALSVLGGFEAQNPLLVPLGAEPTLLVYGLRDAFGAAMFAATMRWLGSALKTTSEASP